MALKLEHYLVTLYLGEGYLHGYVMTNDHRQVDAVVERMMSEAEKLGGLWLPLVLETRLNTGADIVRNIVTKLMPEAAKLMAEATDCHFTAFIMNDAHPDNATLMELH